MDLLCGKNGLPYRRGVPLYHQNGCIYQGSHAALPGIQEHIPETTLPGRFAPAAAEHPTILDIGANVGFFSLFAASRWGGAVFAYEPVQANYEEMVNNVKANPHVTITCRRMAVSGASGTIEMFFDHTAALTTTATACPSGRKSGKAEKVKAVTLQDIFEQERLRTVDLLKMDCEGSEFSILYHTNPATLRRIGQMAIEVHGNADDDTHNAHALGEFLTAAGFTVRSNEGHVSLGMATG